jgi:uncharacterized protein YbaA (DUF1428 family)
MPRYVDGFVVPVPKTKVAAYRKLARLARRVWLEYGALDYVECLADDVPPGKRTDFQRSVKLRPEELVVFAYIVYRSRRHRDSVNKKVMADPRFAGMDPKTLPFDAGRMIYGGFRSL